MIEKNKNLKFLNTMRLEVIADYYIKPENIIQLKEAIKFAKENNFKIFILGNGSNIIFQNKRIKNTIFIDMKAFNKIFKEKENIITFEGGTLIRDAINYCIKNKLSGLEFLAGIPGTVGGAVKMNAGAFGKSVSDIVIDVVAFNIEKETEEKVNNIKFSYRKTEGLENKIVTKVSFKLKKSNVESIKRKIKKYMEQRRKKQPSGFSAGSIFKNPKNNFAGKLIEDTGLKGYSINDAYISEKHANFIINRKNASPYDIIKLIELAKKKVLEKYGIELQEEIIRVD